MSEEMSKIDVKQMPLSCHHDVVRMPISNSHHIRRDTIPGTRTHEIFLRIGSLLFCTRVLV